MDDKALRQWLTHNPLTKLTEHTITDPAVSLTEIEKIQRNGYAIVDGEMELGPRSLAVPVRERDGRVIAAANIATFTGRTPLEELRDGSGWARSSRHLSRSNVVTGSGLPTQSLI